MGRYHNRIVCLGVSLRAEHPLDGVAGEGVEEEREEDDEAEPEEDLDDGPLVVVPDDVTDRLDRVQEPHERRVRTPTEEMNTKFAGDHHNITSSWALGCANSALWFPYIWGANSATYGVAYEYVGFVVGTNASKL